MILPTNGKVIVFDDNYSQVKDLLSVLSKERVPYVYYQDETGEDLPSEPIKNVRLIFLDIQLVSGQTLSSHNIISTIGGRLSRVLERNNNYILVYWSTKKDKYKKVLTEAFSDKLKDFKPILTVSLDKTEALKEENNTLELILDEIKDKSEDFKLFKIFALWENLVNNSAGHLINDFTNFISKDDNWDDSTKYLLHKLSEAYSGKTINEKNDNQKLKDALFTLNHTLLDTIEDRVVKTIIEKNNLIKDIVLDIKESEQDFAPLINNKLLLSQMEFQGNVPGCIFLIEQELESKKQLINNKLEKVKNNNEIPADKKDKAIENAQKKRDEDIRNIDFSYKSMQKNFNIIVNSLVHKNDETERKKTREEILDSSIKIELNISPLCDFAQQKMQCVRMIPGLLLKSDLKNNINASSLYNYLSDSIINFNGENYYLLFDFRFLYSRPEKAIKQRKAFNKIKHQLLSEIQLKLGAHITRSGVLYVQ